jgi:hypothetical protein
MWRRGCIFEDNMKLDFLKKNVRGCGLRRATTYLQHSARVSYLPLPNYGSANNNLLNLNVLALREW